MKIMLQLNIFCRHYIQHLGVALNHVLHLSTALMQHSQHQQAKEYVVQDKIWGGLEILIINFFIIGLKWEKCTISWVSVDWRCYGWLVKADYFNRILTWRRRWSFPPPQKLHPETWLHPVGEPGSTFQSAWKMVKWTVRSLLHQWSIDQTSHDHYLWSEQCSHWTLFSLQS